MTNNPSDNPPSPQGDPWADLFEEGLKEDAAEPSQTESLDTGNAGDPPRRPSHVDHFTILDELGEGGFGTVYLTQQEQPVRRRVALKVIKLGMDTGEVIARFKGEQQALAMMDHPNVAKIFDAGITDRGQPYFAMEYVPGIPITSYCDKHQLDMRQRLELFIQVCHAIQHAHQKGIIHRDISPSNVLVAIQDDQPVPKVIDFGVAKATDHRLTQMTVYTEQGRLIGKPEYMSPEQAEMTGLDIDTRTDVYSLGVLLYELATGTLPFDPQHLRSGSCSDMQRIIREEEPARPSTRLRMLHPESASFAKARRTGIKDLVSELRGDLDWIIMRAMDKDRTRRYATASELASDITRHLNNEPVFAGPPSTVYLVKKLYQRHRIEFLGVACFVFLLTAFAVAMTIQSARVSRQRDAARQSQMIAEQAKDRAQAAERRATTEAERANREATNARTAQGVADQRSEELRRRLYVHRINLADYAYAEHNKSHMGRLLSQCPPDLRGWEWQRLNWLHDRGTVSLDTHTKPILCSACSPDGKWIATGSADKTVRAWHVEPLETAVPFQGHTDKVNGVAFSPDSKRIASCSDDGTVRIWAISTRDAQLVLRGHQGRVHSVAFSSDGKKIISAGSDRTIRAWDSQTGRPRYVSRGHTGAVYSVGIGPDDGQLVSGSEDRTIRVWDADSGEAVRILAETAKRTTFVDCSPDGKCVLSCSTPITSDPWTWRQLNHTPGVEDAITVWDAASGKARWTLTGHAGPVYAARFSPDGSSIVSAGFDFTVRLWDVKTGTQTGTLTGPPRIAYCVEFTPSGNWVVSGGGASRLARWNLLDVHDSLTFAILRGPKPSLAASPDGKWFVVGDYVGNVVVWDTATGTRKMRLVPKFSSLRTWTNALKISRLGPAYQVAVSADGRQIAACRWNGALDIWDATTGEHRLGIDAHVGRGSADCLAWSPDGKWLASGGGESWWGLDPTVRVWNSETGEPRVVLKGHSGSIGSVQFMSDGKLIVSCGGRHKVRIWDVATGRAVRTLHSKVGRIFHVACSPNGRFIAEGGENFDIRLWDLDETRDSPIRTLTGHWNAPHSLAFSPDGTRLVSGGADNLIKVWDVATGLELLTLKGHANLVRSVTFTHDGKSIISAGDDKTIRIWPSGPPEKPRQLTGS